MINIAICDDNKIHCKITYDMIVHYEQNRECDINIDIYLTGKRLLEVEKKYDILFMDIELKEENGMNVAVEYRKKQDTKVILLTSHVEQIANGYKIYAYRFLVKPLIIEDLFEALDSAIKEINNEKTLIVIAENKTKHIIKVNSIIYLEAGERITGIRTKEQFYIIRKNISEVQKEVFSPNFYMTHRSYIVNLNFVDEIKKTEIVLTNGEKIKLSRLKVTDFKKKYFEFLKKKVQYDF